MAVENISLMFFESPIGTLSMDDDKNITINVFPNEERDEHTSAVLDVLLNGMEKGNYIGVHLMPKYRGPGNPSLTPRPSA